MKRQAMAGVVLACAFVAAAGFAVHYRAKAQRYFEELSAAKNELQENQRGLEAVADSRNERQAAVSERAARRPPAGAKSEDVAEPVLASGAGVTNRVVAEASAGERSRTNRQSRASWMEALKQEDPQRYEELQKRRVEAQESVQKAFVKKADYFLSRETSGMTETELADYNRMLALLDQTWKLTALMQSDLSRDQRHEVMDTVRSNMSELAPLMMEERNREFQDYAVALGFSPQEAAIFATNMNAVIDATTVQNLFRGMTRGGPFGRGGDASGRRPPPQVP